MELVLSRAVEVGYSLPVTVGEGEGEEKSLKVCWCVLGQKKKLPSSHSFFIHILVSGYSFVDRNKGRVRQEFVVVS